jgi:hypothetical protein
MLILTNAGTDKLQVITSSAATVDVHAGWADLLSGAVTPGRTNTALSSAATTDVVATPAASTTRNVKTINIRNKDTVLSCDVTVVYNQNGTSYQLHKATLNTGDALEYIEGVGWFLITSTAKLDTKLRVATDVANATTSFADITGLTVAVKNGKQYCFEAHIYHIENASTTGARFAVNGPTMTAMRVNGFSVFAGSLTAATFASATADVAAVDTSILGVTTTSAGTPQVVIAIMSGWINPSADGTFACRSQSEVAVAAGVTVKAGSWCRIWETDN